MFNRPWTEEERAVLHKLALDGISANQAARKLNRSKNSVLGFAMRQFGGYGMVRVKPPTLKPMHVAKPKASRKDNLSPSGRSLKRKDEGEIQVLITPVEPLPDVKPVRMLKIGRLQCKYIVSNVPRDHNPLMCGAPVKGTGSWCPHHHRLVFNPVPPKKAAARKV